MKYRKKRYSKKKNVSNAVKKYVKKQLTKNLETKTSIYATAGNVLNRQQLVSWNIMYYTAGSQGAGTGQIIGDSIFWKGLSLEFSAVYSGTNSVTGYISIIKSRVQNTITSLSSNDVFHNDMLSPTDCQFDSSKVQVIWKKRVTITPQIGNPAQIERRIAKYIKINKKLQFQDKNNSSLLKDYQYYIVFYADQYGTIAGQSTGLRITINKCRIYYTDA